MKQIYTVLITILGWSALVACGETAPTPQAVAKIVVTPAAILLEKVGASQNLQAQAYDAAGNPINAQLEFSVDNTNVSLSNTTVTANALGSSQVKVKSGDVSTLVSVQITEPVAGAILVNDVNITGKFRPVDPTATFGVGYQYTFTLTNMTPPAVGAIMVGTGNNPIGGKVIAVVGNDVTLEVLPLEEVLPNFRLNETINLKDVPFEFNQEVKDTFDITKNAGGTYDLKLKAGKVITRSNRQRSKTGRAGKYPFDLGPLKCEAQVSLFQISLAKFEINFDPGFSMERIWEPTHKRFVLVSNAKAGITVKPVLQSQLEGKLTCKGQLTEIYLPLPGPAGLLAGAIIPVGLGFEIEAKVPLVAGISLEFKREYTVTSQAGFDCTTTCTQVAGFNNTSPASGVATPSVNLSLPSLADLKPELSFYAFVYADLEFGGSKIVRELFDDASAGILETKAGLKFEAKVALEEAQAKDEAYKSEYNFKFEAGLEAGGALEKFIKFIKITPIKLELKLTQELGTSPKASLSLDKTSFKKNDPVTATVSFIPGTQALPLFGYNVNEVRVYRKSTDATGNVVLTRAGQTIAQTGDAEVKIAFKADVDSAPDVFYIAFTNTKLFDDLFLELDTANAVDTIPKQWQPAMAIASGDINFLTPQIKMDAAGNAIAVWSETLSDGNYRIRAKRYNASLESWEAAIFVDSATTLGNTDAQISMDTDGNATVVWTDNGFKMYVNRYTVSTNTWGTASLLDADSTPYSKVAFNAKGDGVAVWVERKMNNDNSFSYDIYAKQYTFNSNSWSNKILIVSKITSYINLQSSIKVVIDSLGNAVAIWVQSNKISDFPFVHSDIWSSHFNSKTGSWSEANPAENSSVDEIYSEPNISMDLAGNAIMIWDERIIDYKTGNEVRNVNISRYDASSSSWGGSNSLTTNGISTQSQIALDSVGNATVVWIQNLGDKALDYNFGIWTKHYKASTASWGVAEIIETNRKYNPFPHIGLSSTGNAVALWFNRDQNPVTMVARVLK
jgi:hypothetical protein